MTDYVAPAVTRTPEQEIYARAADLLEREGWCINSLRRDDGARCINGALRAARGFTNEEVWLTPDLYDDADDALARGLGFDSAESAASWNNAQEDGAWVIARLKAAAG